MKKLLIICMFAFIVSSASAQFSWRYLGTVQSPASINHIVCKMYYNGSYGWKIDKFNYFSTTGCAKVDLVLVNKYSRATVTKWWIAPMKQYTTVMYNNDTGNWISGKAWFDAVGYSQIVNTPPVYR
ncbi:MAG: hypothetical protein KAQ75_15100 [Bacteroidales bacterium]|nr:hypothetical protein [Bacteroidales bacterium]